MIFVVFALTLLSICKGDVSHLDTDLRDDGYHYKQPYKPFPPGKNDLDDQLGSSIPQQTPGIRPQPTRIVPLKPTAEYLPPDQGQIASQSPSSPRFPNQPTLPGGYGPPSASQPPSSSRFPIQPTLPEKDYGSPVASQPPSPSPRFPTQSTLPGKGYGAPSTSQPPSSQRFPIQPTAPPKEYVPPSTFLPQTPAEPTKEYGPPTTFIPQTPPSGYTQKPTGKTSEQYGPPQTIAPQTRRPQLRPSSISPAPGPQQSSLPASPEREYLPPGDNDISAEQSPKGVFPAPGQTLSPKFPAQQPTLPTQKSPIPQPGPKSKYPGTQPTIQVSQPTYPAPESTYPTQRPTYPEPQPSPTYETGPQSTGPNYEESEPAHELGPDGYKYKVPSNKFRF